jgi:hypothetical protein
MINTDVAQSPAREPVPAQALQPHQLTRLPVRLSPDQVDALGAELHPGRIAYDDRGNAHVSGWDVRATLTRIFGFGMWSETITRVEKVQDNQYTQGGHWNVSWMVSVQLVCWDAYGTPLGPYEGITIETVTMGNRGNATELAIKSAATVALKRAAINLGNQFGLSLYRKPGTGDDGKPVPRGKAVTKTLQPVVEDADRAPVETAPEGQDAPETGTTTATPALPGKRPEDVVPKRPAPPVDEAAEALARERAQLRDLVVNLGADPEELDAATTKAFGVPFDDTTLDQVRTVRAAIEKRSARRG